MKKKRIVDIRKQKKDKKTLKNVNTPPSTHYMQKKLKNFKFFKYPRHGAKHSKTC